MTFAFEPDPELPLLSWCARLQPGSAVRVRHGAGIETRAAGFVEGAWDGDYDAFEFDAAETLCGSGGRLREGGVVFAAPSHPLERLFALQRRGELFVSNSMVFLLSQAGDGLDLSYPRYYFDFLERSRHGLTPPETKLPTRNGQAVYLFPCCNVRVGANLAPIVEPKPLGPPPQTYAELFRFILGSTRNLAANAMASGRARTFRLVAACSRGYDSTAAAAIASQAGCREGVTYVRSTLRSGHPITGLREEIVDDSGADSLRALGMIVREFDRIDASRLQGFARAEFFINAAIAMTDATTALMADALAGSVFVSGRHGERYWGPTRRCARVDLREVDDCLLSGHGLAEFRLRIGFLHLPLPYIGARHGPAIYRITHSREMDPWRLGTGYYDRPIARRMAEEAGVPRACFGHQKVGTAVAAWRELNAESRADLDAFVASEVPGPVRRRLDHRPRAARIDNHRRLAYFRTHYAHLPMGDWLARASGLERLHLLYNSVNQYQFHWGFERTRERYRH
jgi:hypothetical protein